MTSFEILIALIASLIGGMGTAFFSFTQEKRKDKARAEEKARDELKIELKDLQIRLYQLEKDLDEWKDKYYAAIQELIVVKSELEGTLIKLNHIEIYE